jgi:hypothetical protein
MRQKKNLIRKKIEHFYTDLSNVPKYDAGVLMSDFNAKIGK